MTSLQAPSIKIKKRQRSLNPGDNNYQCGCSRKCSFRSYSALYQHIKRKHNGIKPPNTRVLKQGTTYSNDRIHTGRPQKPSKDIDDVTEDQLYIEKIQSDFIGFLGEDLNIVSSMDSKPDLEMVATEIANICDEANDVVMNQLKDQIVKLSQELKHGHSWSVTELDFDDFSRLDRNNILRILCWFLLWLGRYTVKLQALKELTIIFSKVWIILVEKQLEISDLDNKLVWNGVVKQCEVCLSKLACFGGKKELIYEFVRRMCHLIGKCFE